MSGLRSAALVGNPNAGKSALFNALTGARQKIANYPGVTVERKAGRLLLPSGEPIALTDLPGSYSLTPTSPDEEVTRKVILGEFPGEPAPQVLVVVLDASNLEQHLVFAQEIIALGRPTVIALNMVDLAERDGLVLDPQALQEALGVPVIPTVAVRRRGLTELAAAIAAAEARAPEHHRPHTSLGERRLTAHAIADGVILSETARHRLHAKLDRVLLHPWLGPLILFVMLFVVFQAVFTGAQPFADGLQAGVDWLSGLVCDTFPAGLPRDLITDGVIAGVGAVVVFLPQIVILFFFILAMEASGYMARAAFLMDRLMARVGLSGRSFIPLLSSFACAVPGIMATRSIADPKDRLTTILVAPLMTCSARLPVYTLIIAAFIPNRVVLPGMRLQGLVMLGLYVAGIVGAMLAALILRRTIAKGSASGFIMELPKYQLPQLKDMLLGLYQRVQIFLRRAGTIILTVSVVLWLLLNFPRAGEGQNQVDASIAGHVANGLAVVLEPIGFNRDIALALIPAMAAREVAVASLATTYAVGNTDDVQQAQALGAQLTSKWSLATALAFLAWFVFAPQCMSTIAVTRRETNGWKWPMFMLGYLFALAYVFAGLTYWTAVWLGLG